LIYFLIILKIFLIIEYVLIIHKTFFIVKMWINDNLKTTIAGGFNSLNDGVSGTPQGTKMEHP